MKRKTWNTKEFNKINLPLIVGRVDTRFSEFNGIRVLDMPIFMPDQGWKIPDFIFRQFMKPIQLVSKFEKQYSNFEKDHYVYITIDQKIVKAGNTGRRAGAHSDAYIETKGKQIDLTLETSDAINNEIGEVSHTYILYDKFPTEFFRARFPLKETGCNESLKTFDEIAETAEIVTYPNNTVLMLDPYVVHRSAVAQRTEQRTFLKISISRKKYARIGNTINEMFEYDWSMKARSLSERNHPW